MALLGVMELVKSDTNSFEVDVLLGGQLVMLVTIMIIMMMITMIVMMMTMIRHLGVTYLQSPAV